MRAPPLRYRVATHAQSLKSDENQTALSKKIKQLVHENTDYNLKFHLIETRPAYSPETKRCDLCISEIYNILYGKFDNLLNSKHEIINICRHRSRFKLQKAKD